MKFLDKKKKTEYELFLEFMRSAKERMTDKMDRAMFEYLEEIYKKAVSSQKKLEKQKPKVSVWISDDLGIDQTKKREQEAEKNKLPHPVEK